jgi:predicted DNA-binding transcriptional regulator AlpA
MSEVAILADHISDEDLGRELNKSLKTLWRWHKEGRGPRRIKIGKEIFYSRASVAEWLKSLESGGPKRQRSRSVPEPRRQRGRAA